MVFKDQARGQIVVWLAVAVLGWFLFRQFSLEWSINPQYSYGWVVPLLAAYLFWDRWKDRPQPEKAIHILPVFFALLLLMLPIRLVEEANPDWRLISWMAALAVVGISWLGILAMGGRVWWKHFAFATAFILVAVPWPTPLENILVHSLMRGVAAVAVEALNWIGIAAQQEGNLIRLASGTLGIDEACSGVRSFQATLMATLFLGELHRIALLRRFVLLGIGVVAAILFNFIRTLSLAFAAARNGIDAVERWHDPAGYALLVVTFFALLGISRILRTRTNSSNESSASPSASIPWRAAVIVIVWLLGCEGATAAWYRAHERGDQRQARWDADFPYQPVWISENIRLLLRFNHGQAAIWNRDGGSQWHLFFFSWKPGRVAANLARNHRPETCLPATGFQFVRSRGIQTHHVDGLDLPIERLEFTQADQQLHVYYCLWEDRVSPGAEGPQLLTRENRIRAVLQGRRHLGQRVLEVVIVGNQTAESADEAFAAELPKWIKVKR
jgi:exosortase